MQPPASLKALGDPIYEAFYGLTEQPFAITTDPRFFYLSASHQRAFSELLNGLRRRESLVMLTGETGTGKTTMCRAVLAALGDRTFSAIILNPYMTGAEVLRIVLRDFGLVSHEELRRGGLSTADVPQLLDTLEGFLQSLIPLGSHAVIVLDEAQSLSTAVLDQIRLLTGLEHQGKRLLQVVLCGQPGLLETIKADSLRALNERITRRIELSALPPEDIPGYIEHRLGVAGGAASVFFDGPATQTVADLSRGLPRRVNVLCDRALQEGRIEGVNVITSALVKRAARAVAGVHETAAPTPLAPEPVRASTSMFGPPATTPAPAPASVPVIPPPVAETPVEPTPAVSRPADVVSPPAVTTPEPALAAPTPAPVDAVPVPAVETADRFDLHDAVAVAPVPVAPVQAAPIAPVTAIQAAAAAVAAVPLTPTPVAAAASRPAAPPSIWAPVHEMAAADDSGPGHDDGQTTQEFPTERVEPAPAADHQELSFGLEKSDSRSPVRMAAAIAAGLALIGAIAYATWAWSAGDIAGVIPSTVTRPVFDPGAPATPFPLPSPEEIRALRPVRRLPASDPPLVETPDDVAPLPEPAPEPPSPPPAAGAPVN